MLANFNEPDKKTKKQNAGNLKEKWRILSDVAGKLKKNTLFYIRTAAWGPSQLSPILTINLLSVNFCHDHVRFSLP